MYKTRNTKLILNEWRNFLNNSILLNEVSKRDLEKTLGADLSSILFSRENIKYTNDNAFLDLINNTFGNPNNNHSLEDVLAIFDEFRKHISSNWNSNQIIDFNMAGRSIKLERTSSTYDDVLQYIELKNATNVKSKTLIDLENSQTSDNQHYEILVNDENWFIAYPKTQIGSMFLGRSYWNIEENKLKYDYTFVGGIGEKTGKISWCTVVSGESNMFLSYHANMKLHMYYCINKNTTPDTEDRKLCLSIAKTGDKIKFTGGNASVNGNNLAKDEEYFKYKLGSIYELLIEDVKNNRDDLDVEKYYSEYNLEQLKITYDTMHTEEDFRNFTNELKLILKFTKDMRIFDFIFETNKETLLIVLIQCERTPQNILYELSNFSNIEIINAILSNIHLIQNKELQQELLERHSNNTNPDVVYTILSNIKLIQNKELQQELLERHSNDTNPKVIYTILNNIELIQNKELQQEILEKYTNNNIEFVTRSKIIYNLTSIVKDSKIRQRLLKIFCNDEDENIVSRAIHQLNLIDDIMFRESIFEKYSNSTNSDIMYAILNKIELIQNKELQQEILERYSNSSETSIMCTILNKIELIQNKELQQEILERYSNSSDTSVMRTILNKIELIQNKELQQEILERYSNSSETIILSYLIMNIDIIENRELQLSILEKCSNNKNKSIRILTALSPKCDIELLNLLSNNVDQNVRLNTALNINCTFELCNKIISKLDSKQKKQLLKPMYGDFNLNYKNVLNILSDDYDPNIRLSVIKHSKCTKQIAIKLSNDPDKKVKNTALKRLKLNDLVENFNLLRSYLKLLIN